MKDIFEILLTFEKDSEVFHLLWDLRIPCNHMVDNEYFLLLKGNSRIVGSTETETDRIFKRFRISESEAVSLRKKLTGLYKKSFFTGKIKFKNTIPVSVSINEESVRRLGIKQREAFSIYQHSMELFNHCKDYDSELNHIQSLIRYDDDYRLYKGITACTDCLLDHNTKLKNIAETGTSDNKTYIRYCKTCARYFAFYDIDHPYGGNDQWYSPLDNNDLKYIEKGEYEKVNQFSDIMIIEKNNGFFLASRCHYYAESYMHKGIFSGDC